MRAEIKKNEQGQYWVVQVAENGEILNTSEMFTSKQAAHDNIAAVRRETISSFLRVEDRTGET